MTKITDNVLVWCLLILSTMVCILIITSGCCHFYKAHYRGDISEELLIEKIEKDVNEKI